MHHAKVNAMMVCVHAGAQGLKFGNLPLEAVIHLRCSMANLNTHAV